MNDMRFLVPGNSAIETKKLLEKAGKITLDWETRNAITCCVDGTKAMLFFKARKEKLLKQSTAT